MIQHSVLPRGDSIQGTGCLRGWHLANALKTMPHPLRPQGRIRIQDYIFGLVVCQEFKHGFSQFPLQLGFKAVVLLVLP
jgi:hypothetical protein